MSRVPTADQLLALITLATFCAAPAPTAAGTQDGTVVTLHAAPHAVEGQPCWPWFSMVEDGLSCRDLTTTWPLQTPCDVYLVLARGKPDPGVAGVSCGVLYNNGETGVSTLADGEGVDVYSWSDCTSGILFPGPDHFPSSGGGTVIRWNLTTDCQTGVVGNDGVHAMGGVFYIYAYSDDVFEIIPNREHNPGVDEFQVGDCNGQVTDLPYPEAAGAVAFGSGTGYNPCLAVPVIPTTWSRLKTRYHTTSGDNP